MAAGVAERALDARDRGRRRLVGDEVARELGRQMPRGRRMRRQVAQHRFALRQALLGIRLAEQRPRPRLVPSGSNTNPGAPLSGTFIIGRTVQPVMTRANSVTSACV